MAEIKEPKIGIGSNQDIRSRIASGASSALNTADEIGSGIGRMFGSRRAIAEAAYNKEQEAAKKAKQAAKDAAMSAEGARLQKLIDDEKK
jgi:hypothetical protein